MEVSLDQRKLSTRYASSPLVTPVFRSILAQFLAGMVALGRPDRRGFAYHVTLARNFVDTNMTALDNLRNAGKNYGAAAKALTAKSANPLKPTAHESEIRIAFGIASDWSRRAAALKPLEYNSRLMNKSSRTAGVSELVRFNLAWFGMNALFSRNAVLQLIGTTKATSELDRFKFIYRHSGMSTGSITSFTSTLHSILATQITTTLPGHPIGTPTTTLQAIYEKYTPAHVQAMTNGRKIRSAISTGNMAALDLPTLIYLMRNWGVHGGLIDSSFRSVKRFRVYIDTILEALSEIHLGASANLLTKI